MNFMAEVPLIPVSKGIGGMSRTMDIQQGASWGELDFVE